MKQKLLLFGTVTSIDGSINYNPVTKEYTMPQTVGKIQVNQVLKGDIKEKEIPFIRLGGVITLSEYEKSLQKEQIEKRGLDKLSQEEKNNEYVSETMEGDISIEKGKTYLMYLIYREDYSSYSIRFFQYGLREIDTKTLNLNEKTLTLNDFKTIKVKNNKDGNLETLDSIIPDKVKKIK